MANSDLPKQCLVAYFRTLTILVVLAALVFGLRYWQRSTNYDVLSQKIPWYDSPVRIDFYNTHLVGFMSQFPVDIDWQVFLREPPDDTLSVQDVNARMRLFSEYAIYPAERRYIEYLKERQDERAMRGILEDHLDRIYEKMWRADRDRRYADARYHAQRFLNIAYDLPPSRFFDRSWIADRLSAANAALDYVKGAYPYDETSVADRVAYKELARSTEYTWSASDAALWDQFLRNHPYSVKRDEARMNMLNIRLETLDRSRESYAQTVVEFSRFIDDFPESYLADDAAWHALRLAASLGNDPDTYRYFSILNSQFAGSDHQKRLIYSLQRWFESIYRASPEISRQIVAVLTSMPSYQVQPVRSALALQLASESERNEIRAAIATVLRQAGSGDRVIHISDVDDLPPEVLVSKLMTKWIGPL